MRIESPIKPTLIPMPPTKCNILDEKEQCQSKPIHYIDISDMSPKEFDKFIDKVENIITKRINDKINNHYNIQNEFKFIPMLNLENNKEKNKKYFKKTTLFILILIVLFCIFTI